MGARTLTLGRPRLLAAAVVAAGVLAYPLAVLAGGLPHFPSSRSCEPRATADGRIELLFGRFDDVVSAAPLVQRVRSAGFAAAGSWIDACGKVVVTEPGYTTVSGAEDAVQEAASVGLKATPVAAP
jgi:hypothetical protein